MRFDSQSRRVEPRWVFPATEINEEDTAEAVYAATFLPHKASSILATERVFDDALDQVASEKRCACPLCGAIVASDGTVISAGFPGPGDYWVW
jgi:hypothetical protein